MKSIKTTIGGAVSTLGTSLIGVGVLPQLTQLSPASSVISSHQLTILWYVALAGFIFSGVGKFLTALFAADKAALERVQAQIREVPAAINTNDTRFLERAIEQPTKKDP